MSLQLKPALAMPFTGAQALIALAIGTILCLPAAYIGSQPHYVGWLSTLASIISTVIVGYEVRIMRTQFAHEASGVTSPLPSWLGNPKDMVFAMIADFIGGATVGSILLAIAGIGIVLAVSGIVPPSMVTEVKISLLHSPIITAPIAIPLFVLLLFALIPLVPFALMMQVHYAYENRLSAVFEWRTIWRVTWNQFGTIFCVGLLSFLVLALLTIIASAFWPLVAFVSFLGSVVTTNLCAQIYLNGRSA